jgi:carboxyl-terminal processing protease
MRFDEFYPDVRRWVHDALVRSVASPALIIDLRYNAGGEQRQLNRILGYFFDKPVDCGTVVTRAGARTLTHASPDATAHYAGRIVVLVEAATASSSEIFCAVMKDQRRATIVGRKTAGAVLVSEFHDLPGGGQLQLSEEDYIAPNGRRIESNGIEPDVVVTRTIGELRAGHDPDLEAALKVLHATDVQPKATAAR